MYIYSMADRVSTAPTSKHLRQLLPSIMKEINRVHARRPDLILAAWPSLVGDRIASMSFADSFVEGILTIKVRNSSLLSLLVQHERPRLLRELRRKFPDATIRNIRFCIG